MDWDLADEDDDDEVTRIVRSVPPPDALLAPAMPKFEAPPAAGAPAPAPAVSTPLAPPRSVKPPLPQKALSKTMPFGGVMPTVPTPPPSSAPMFPRSPTPEVSAAAASTAALMSRAAPSSPPAAPTPQSAPMPPSAPVPSAPAPLVGAAPSAPLPAPGLAPAGMAPMPAVPASDGDPGALAVQRAPSLSDIDPSFAPARKSGVPKALVAVAVVLALALLGAVALLLMPRDGTLLIAVSGPGSESVDNVEVFVDGERRCTKPQCRVERLKPGKYGVKAMAPGYADASEHIVEVGAGKEAVANLKLGSRTAGTVRISSKGVGLKLWLDGKEIGPLPQELADVSPGEHSIKVAGSDAFEPFEKTIEVSASAVTDLEIKPIVAKGVVRIEEGENAGGADVRLAIGDELRALTKLPIKLAIPANQEHFIIAKKAGFAEFRQKIEFEPGEPERTVVVNLSKPGKAEPEEPPEPVAVAPAPVAAAPKAVAAAPVAAAPKPAPVAAAPAPAPAPVAGTGTVNVNSIPPSSVTVNGRALGSTPKTGIEVPAGSVTAVFTHPEFGTQSRSAVVKPGGSVTLAVRFKTPE